MSDTMLKIAGKTEEGTAKPFLIGDNGETIVERPWTIDAINIVSNEEIRDTTARTNMPDAVVDMSKYPINSLRIRSSLDADLIIQFYADLNKTSSTYIEDDNGVFEITIPANDNYFRMVTPKQLELLTYGKYLKFRYAASTVPTTGVVTITHVGKY